MKLRIPDDQMILSLMGSSAHHRRAITWWLFRNFNWVGVTPGFDHAYPDKNALSIEILTQYLAQLETLEMVYFALREKVKTPTRSFTECYLGIKIREYDPNGSHRPSPWCAYTMVEQLKGMTVARFQAELGMPHFEDLKAATCGEPIHAARGDRVAFEGEVLRLIDWMSAAVGNKVNRSLHQAFIKSKHGFGVLTSPHYAEIRFIESTQPIDGTACHAEVFQFDNSDKTLEALVEDTRVVGGIMRELLGMYIGRSPVHSCDHCKQSGETPCAEPGPPTAS